MLVREAPKYGNDIEEVDLLAARAYGSYLDEIGRYRIPLGQGTIGGRTSRDLVGQRERAAGSRDSRTPDGRKRVSRCGGLLAQPRHGHPRPTAVFTSVSRLPVEKITVACSSTRR